MGEPAGAGERAGGRSAVSATRHTVVTAASSGGDGPGAERVKQRRSAAMAPPPGGVSRRPHPGGNAEKAQRAPSSLEGRSVLRCRGSAVLADQASETPCRRGSFRSPVGSATPNAPAPHCVSHESHGDDACCDTSYVPGYSENRPLRVRLYSQSLGRLEEGDERNEQTEQKATNSGRSRYVPHKPQRCTKHESRYSPHENLPLTVGIRFQLHFSRNRGGGFHSSRNGGIHVFEKIVCDYTDGQSQGRQQGRLDFGSTEIAHQQCVACPRPTTRKNNTHGDANGITPFPDNWAH